MSNTFEHTLSDGTKVRLPVERLSYSALSLYLRCPMQYYFRYVEGHKEPPAAAMVTGTAGHTALEQNNLHKIKTGEDLPEKTVLDTFSDSLVVLAKDVEDWSGDSLDTLNTQGRGVLAEYVKSAAPLLQPVHAERSIDFTVSGIPFVARIDLENADGTVLDYKVVGKRSSYLNKGAAETSLQLALYGVAAESEKAGFCALVKDTQKVCFTPTRSITPGVLTELDVVVTNVVKAISAGAFPLCDEGNWWCSEKWCGYHHRCRGAMAAGTYPAPIKKASPMPRVITGIKVSATKAPPRRKA